MPHKPMIRFRWIKIETTRGHKWHAVHPLGMRSMCKQHQVGLFAASNLRPFPAETNYKPDPNHICKNCLTKIENSW